MPTRRRSASAAAGVTVDDVYSPHERKLILRRRKRAGLAGRLLHCGPEIVAAEKAADAHCALLSAYWFSAAPEKADRYEGYG